MRRSQGFFPNLDSCDDTPRSIYLNDCTGVGSGLDRYDILWCEKHGAFPSSGVHMAYLAHVGDLRVIYWNSNGSFLHT